MDTWLWAFIGYLIFLLLDWSYRRAHKIRQPGVPCPGCGQNFEVASEPECANGLRYCRQCKARARCGC